MQRILVVLPNWFGETLFATPFIRLLRQLNPKSFIAVLGWPQTHEVLIGNPNINLLIPFEEQGNHKGLPGMWRLARELRSHDFDTAFILRKSLSRTLLAFIAGISNRIGFKNAKSGWLLTRSVAASRAEMHKASTYLQLLSAKYSHASDLSYQYTIAANEGARSAALLGDCGLHPGYILLHLGANWQHKRWPNERFAELANRLMDKQGVELAISGAPTEAADAAAIQKLLNKPAGILAGKTTLRELAACCAQAAVVVANDTGLMHIACALGRPVVALFGPTAPAITGPLGNSSITAVIHHADSCPSIPCYHPDEPPHPGMRSISVEEVYQAVCKLLGRQP